jgi:hypothetical protein
MIQSMTPSEFHHLLDSLDALSPDQMRQLRRELDSRLAASASADEPALTAEELAHQEAQRRLLKAGVISEIRPARRVSTGTEQFAPIPIQGEPLSETVIRERR